MIAAEPLVTGAQVADHLTVHEGSVRRWRREGMPCHWFNSKMVRYRLSEVENWLRAKMEAHPVVVIPPHMREAGAIEKAGAKI
jgi:hypothetical protein